tara:strand:+ start:297 stop:461 length:165 start_codon:yes stop_codon:yes gene_type:complete
MLNPKVLKNKTTSNDNDCYFHVNTIDSNSHLLSECSRYEELIHSKAAKQDHIFI